jgi:SPP1 gp7 family putative phage head morphogenesis protein
MRQFAAAFSKSVRRHILPQVERFAPPPEERTDAADGSPTGLVANVRRDLKGAPAQVGAAAGVVADRVTKHSKGEFKRLGIKLRKAEPRLDKLIATWRSDNVTRVKSLLSDELQKLQEILREGEGRRPESLAKEIEERIGVTGRKAEFLARDQVLTLNGQITQFRQQAAGITEYRWTSSGDERVREMHEALDGEKFSWDDPPVTNEAGDTNHPGGDYNCRCTAYPVLPELEEMEEDEPAALAAE